MSTIQPTHDRRDETDRRDHFDSMTPKEQLRGMLVVLVVLLLAILLRSM